MKKIFRIFTTLALLGCANCGVSGTNAAAGEQTADPVAEAEAEPAPVEVRPVDAALIVISKESMSLAVYDFCSRLLVSYPIACGKGIGNKEKVWFLTQRRGYWFSSKPNNEKRKREDVLCRPGIKVPV